MYKLLALSLILMFACIGVNAATSVKMGDWAKYGLIPARRDAKVSVESITLIIGSTEQGMRWWQMDAVKPGGSTYSIRLLSERVPMVGRKNDIGRVSRYLFKDGDRPFIEYKDKSTGKALLPEFDFRAHLVPCSTLSAQFDGVFATSGQYIGHPIQLLESGSGKTFPSGVEAKMLILDTTLIIGTGRIFRDTNDGRLPYPEEYTYRNFTAGEYDEMEAAGINFFLADNDEREGWVRERTVFYDKPPTAADFPNIFYRSNYSGCVMFIDEPAVLTDYSSCKRMSDASNLLRFRVADQYANCESYGSRVITNRLKHVGVCLGVWDLTDKSIPSWEAFFTSVYYQMEAGACGLVHEGRYQLADYNKDLSTLFGTQTEVNAEEMFLLNYAFMRGAARCFKGNWGTSIYGQADPKLSPLAMSMAYDMGAKYLWFWTSDHDHHMPYREQLNLTRKLRAHEKAHPRPPMAKLRNKAKVAVAFPEGYVYFAPWLPWNNPKFSLDKLNDVGVPHRDVIAAAMREGIRLAKQGISFDFAIDGEPVKKAGYKQIIRIGLDGKIKK